MWENILVCLEDKFTDPITLYTDEVSVQETIFYASKLHITGPDMAAYDLCKNFTPESWYMLWPVELSSTFSRLL